MKQLVRKTGPRHKITHQNEEGNDRQRVGKPSLINHLPDTRQRGRPTACEANTDDADDAHREGQRNPQERHDKDGGKTQ